LPGRAEIVLRSLSETNDRICSNHDFRFGNAAVCDDRCRADAPPSSSSIRFAGYSLPT